MLLSQAPHTAPSVFPGLDPTAYARHALHDGARAWPETNCYVDLLIEVLAAKGFDPRAALGFTVAQDFEGDQFTFFKIPVADLTRLYGIEVLELAIFDDLEGHLAEQVRRGRLPLVELDAFHLPDTRGVSYGVSHSKTTIGINRLDPVAREVDYFHNAGFFQASGDDYDALFRGHKADGLPLFPYTEFVKFDAGRPARDLVAAARDLMVFHLGRRPAANPFRSWLGVIERDLARLASRPPAWFHIYAFNVVRQAGANFGLLAAHLDWLGRHGEPGLDSARQAAAEIEQGTKVMQFQLARAVARKKFAGFEDAILRLATAHDTALDALCTHFLGPAETRAAA